MHLTGISPANGFATNRLILILNAYGLTAPSDEERIIERTNPNMAKRLILHIGSPKTGTTSIQAFMVKNRKQLRKHGYLVPELSARWRNIPAAETGYFLQRLIMQEVGLAPKTHSDERIKACKAEILDQMKDFDGAVILSEERLWYLFGGEKDAVDKLKSFTDSMGFTEYRILAYLRRQDLFAESYWKQFLKTHTDRSLTFEQYLDSDLCKNSADYRDIIDKLESAFGRESLELRIYDRKQLIKQDSVADFFDMLGLEIDNEFQKLAAEKNSHIEGNAFNELKRLAALCPSYASGNSNYLRSIITDASISKGDVNQGGAFSPEERAIYLAQFAEGNRAIAQRYFGRDDLFEPNKVDNLAKWEPATGELASDAFVVLVEALSQERAERLKLEKAHEKQLKKIGREINRLSKEISTLKAEIAAAKEDTTLSVLKHKLKRAIRKQKSN